MTVAHYIVFIGATAPLAARLASLERRIDNARIIAPAAKRKDAGTTKAAIELGLKKLFEELANSDVSTQRARLSLWMYEPSTPEQFEQVWNTFGHAAWVETVPTTYIDKVNPTKEYIQNRINEIRPLLHQVSIAACSQRKSSPLSLPLRNFKSQITQDLKQYWYNDLDCDQISKKIKAFKMRFSQIKHRPKRGFKDEKALIFRPAEDSACHGKAHPSGCGLKSFTCGRFRYGVALFPGFHYDVTAEISGTIQCDLTTSSGNRRVVRREKRTYINIFPNDHLLPQK